jgi:hypothetical protein
MDKGVRFSIQVLYAGDGYFVGWGAMHWFFTIPDVSYYSIGAEILRLPCKCTTNLQNLPDVYQAFKQLFEESRRCSTGGCE